MLKVTLTENYAGFTISGDHEDLESLYGAISYLVDGDTKGKEEYLMQNHIYAFLYDLRHAHQGQREVCFVDNYLDDDTKEWFGIKETDVTRNNLYYSFNYLIPQLLLDMIIIKHFIKKVPDKSKDVYNTNINLVNYFYSLVLNSFGNMLTPIQINKIKKGMLNANIYDKLFFPQWFELIDIDYMKMGKSKRKNEIMHIADKIYNFYDYSEYTKERNKMLKYCKENNCTLDDIGYDYPEELEW